LKTSAANLIDHRLFSINCIQYCYGNQLSRQEMDRLHRGASRISRCDDFTWSVSRANKRDHRCAGFSSGGSLRSALLGKQASPFGVSSRCGYTLTIAHPQNWIALIVFFTTAMAVGQLSARAKQRAQEAEVAKSEIESLYRQLQDAFKQASHAEALKQSEKLKSALLDAVTHDLRTPLASIKASITTLIDEAKGRTEDNQPVSLDAASRFEMLEIIDEESDRLNRFIGGLIEMARIEAGELGLRRRWGPIDEIVSAAIVRAEPVTQRHFVRINIEKELPVVRVDERAVSEVIYTLVDNAAKYSPEGSNIRINARRAGEDLIQVEVEDEGSGIAPELRDRVFEKFFRATRDGDITTRQPSGTGMGLAIAKGIVEAHEGKIWIEPGTGGKGTRVVFTLPIGDEEIVPDSEPLLISTGEKL
jgi:K+-sensing histidine kinase KdpD